MIKLLSLIFVLLILCAATVQAMPVAPLVPVQTGLTVHVSSGCGLGVRRGPLGQCIPVYDGNGNEVYCRAYRRGYYRSYRQDYYHGYRAANYPYVSHVNDTGVIVVDKGVCGFGSYLSCAYGTCWRFCY
jgi:hypothetical protein